VKGFARDLGPGSFLDQPRSTSPYGAPDRVTQASTDMRSTRQARPRFTIPLCALAIAAATAAVWPGPARADAREGIWERGLRTFESEDRKTHPAKHGVLFLGSSSIRLWATREFFPEFSSINRGVSGSLLADAKLHMDRTVFPYEPKIIVFYAGENDISSGARPQRVLTEFQDFVEGVHAQLADTRILFLSIKPSPIRRAIWPKMREANVLVELFCTSDERLRYVDVASPMLDRDGNPREDLFLEDGLHLNVAGYRLWSHVISPLVEEALTEL
jgi:lysophospholipase L1-like esterase